MTLDFLGAGTSFVEFHFYLQRQLKHARLDSFLNLSHAAPCPVLRYLMTAERRQTDATDTRAKAMGQRRQRQHLH